MIKNILVISSSFRTGGNSDTLADEFIKGAQSSGHNVNKINLSGQIIVFCRGCLSCQKTQKCIIKDDAADIVAKMKAADILVFATPIYYYEMSGQLKTLLDRANPLFSDKYSFRDIYLLASAADADEHAADNAINGIKGWVACFEKSNFKGFVLGSDVTNIGEIKSSPALQQAFEMGKNA